MKVSDVKKKICTHKETRYILRENGNDWEKDFSYNLTPEEYEDYKNNDKTYRGSNVYVVWKQNGVIEKEKWELTELEKPIEQEYIGINL